MGTYTELKESQGWFAEFLDTYAGENGYQDNSQSKRWYFNHCNTFRFKTPTSHRVLILAKTRFDGIVCCVKLLLGLIDPLHKWRPNLHNNTKYILSPMWMFIDKEFFT